MNHIDFRRTQKRACCIRFSLAGIKESFFYELLESEKERVRRYFRQLGNAVQVKDFIGFETSDRTKEVLVRGRDVRTMKFTALPKRTKPRKKSERHVGNVTIFTRGREKPFVGTIWDASDAALLMTGLDSEPGAFDRFWTYRNVHGEPVSVRVSDIVLAEIDSAILNEGLRTIPGYDEEEESEEDEESGKS
jgi:hypothetical protein